MNDNRRRWSAKEKMRIVLAGMDPGVNLAELCRREGINPTQYYGWRKKLLSSAASVFDDNGKRGVSREDRQREEIQRLKEVIAEITTENLDLKKGLSG
jgi:transposase